MYASYYARGTAVYGASKEAVKHQEGQYTTLQPVKTVKPAQTTKAVKSARPVDKATSAAKETVQSQNDELQGASGTADSGPVNSTHAKVQGLVHGAAMITSLTYSRTRSQSTGHKYGYGYSINGQEHPTDSTILKRIAKIKKKNKKFVDKEFNLNYMPRNVASMLQNTDQCLWARPEEVSRSCRSVQGRG